MTANAPSPDVADLLPRCAQALAAAEGLLAAAKRRLAQAVVRAGAVDADALEARQFQAHGFAWLATYVAGLGHMLAWARALDGDGRLGAIERLILAAAFGEYLCQMRGGIPMSQGEIARPADLGLAEDDLRQFLVPAVRELMRHGNADAARMRLVGLLAAGAGGFGDPALGDPALDIVKAQFRRFADERIAPHAQRWHLDDRLIPDAVMGEMAALGVFGLTVPEDFGGAGLGKVAMCVVSEELSRAHLGVGSLGTRSEIAAELIRIAGTEAQKTRYLPAIADGSLLPTAVFTEPDAGSDLASVRTRAVRAKGGDGTDVYRVTGAKTWSTHAARADLMTLLARTDPESRDHRGLSMFLARKPRGTDADPFPAPGMRGSEIRVLGYRGMKEYEIAFDGFEVPADALLGGIEGRGFGQLMATLESSRIQTAARAVGVAESALELALRYARERRQFGKPIVEFPRVGGKIAWMAVETMVARQLTLFSARAKDSGKRCDIEAGMAKLLAARVAWANADNALQIHGGLGYAVETPISRVLVDARILSIFEGAAEIQAHVIARGLLQGRN